MSPAAEPSLRTKGFSRGNSPAMLRMPSVPKRTGAAVTPPPPGERRSSPTLEVVGSPGRPQLDKNPHQTGHDERQELQFPIFFPIRHGLYLRRTSGSFPFGS